MSCTCKFYTNLYAIRRQIATPTTRVNKIIHCLCPLQNKEFCQCFWTEKLKLWFEDDTFIAFEWECIETDPDDAVIQADPDKLDADALSVDKAGDDAAVIPSSDPVTFKYIGATKYVDR